MGCFSLNLGVQNAFSEELYGAWQQQKFLTKRVD
jgi:hypothetical protein